MHDHVHFLDQVGKGIDFFDLRVFIAAYNGLFRYEPRGHYLEQVGTMDVRSALATSGVNQMATPPGCVIILASSGEVRTGRVSQKDQKLKDLLVGQITQSVRLQAAGLNLISMPATTLDLNVIRRTCGFAKLITPYHMLFVGYAAGQTPTPGTSNSPIVAPAQDTTKRAAMILPPQGFRDEELIETVRVLNAANVRTVIAGPQLGIVQGLLGSQIQVEIPLQQLDVDNYDALVFVGGQGGEVCC